MGFITEPLSERQKATTMRRLQLIAALAVSTQNYNLASDTALITAACGGDAARAAPLIAATSSVSGLIEFLLNPVLGKLADAAGRKGVYYIGPVVSGVVMSLAVLLTRGRSLPVLLAHRACGWALLSQSCSFIVPITISDMFTGQGKIAIPSRFAALSISLTLESYHYRRARREYRPGLRLHGHRHHPRPAAGDAHHAAHRQPLDRLPAASRLRPRPARRAVVRDPRDPGAEQASSRDLEV